MLNRRQALGLLAGGAPALKLARAAGHATARGAASGPPWPVRQPSPAGSAPAWGAAGGGSTGSGTARAHSNRYGCAKSGGDERACAG